MKLSKKNNIKLFLIISSIIFYIVGFYYRDFSPSGSQGDFHAFVFKNIQLFKENFIYAIKNYGLLNDANYPLFYIFHAYLNPFSRQIESYLLSTFTIGFFTFLIFSFSLKKLNFKLIDSLLLSSIILLLPWFAGRAYWGTSANLGWFFLVTAFYFFIKLKKNIDLSFSNKDLINIFFLCFFSAAALYVRVSFIFFPIYIVLYIFLHDISRQRKIYILFFYLILSIPGFFLILIWGGIYDHANSSAVGEYHSYKNILKNFPIILNYFFFYLWPIYLLEIKDIGINKFISKYFKSFVIIFLFFLILNFIGYFSYLSNYTLGGGAILKIGYLINDNHNILFLITSSFGFSMIYQFLKENYESNLILFSPIFLIYGFPEKIFQDYLEPLIIFLFFLSIINSSLTKKIRENTIAISAIYFIYFFTINLTAIYLKNF